MVSGGPTALITLLQVSEYSANVLFWLCVISMVAMIGGIIGWRLYMAAKRDAAEPISAHDPMTIETLQAMRDRNEISDEEFRTLRQTLLRRMGAFEEADDVDADDDAAGGTEEVSSEQADEADSEDVDGEQDAEDDDSLDKP